MEIKALKCQSCGNGDLNLSSFRVAKCPCCGTVNIISGDSKLCLDLQLLNSPKEGHRIRICLKIAVGLFLREQGYFVDDDNNNTERIYDELNRRINQYYSKLDTRITDDKSPLYIYSLTKKVIPVTTLRLFRPLVIEETFEYEVFQIGYIDFSDDIPILNVSGRGMMKKAEEIMDMIVQGLLLQVDAELRHS